MAQVDVEWPSEDEDFDATTSGKGTSAKTAVATKEPEAKVDETPVEAEEVPTEPEEAEAEAEPAATEPDPQPVADTPITPVVPAAAPKVKGPKRNLTPMLRLAAETLLLIAVIGLGLWGWNLSAENKDLKGQVTRLNANPQALIQKQTDELLAEVGGLITLPKGEVPTIANVTDASQARKQSAFFNTAENGDKVLMYVKAGEAILYRPSTKKIILVAPLTFSNSASTTSTTPTTTTTKK